MYGITSTSYEFLLTFNFLQNTVTLQIIFNGQTIPKKESEKGCFVKHRSFHVKLTTTGHNLTPPDFIKFGEVNYYRKFSTCRCKSFFTFGFLRKM
jgi:hypothetical protein